MSAFNTLNVAIACENCNKEFPIRLQFKFGDTWQFEYKMREKIKWGGNDTGKPHLRKVKVYGMAESTICTFCNHKNPHDEYDIYFEDDVITEIRVMNNIKEYLETDDDYIICEE